MEIARTQFADTIAAVARGDRTPQENRANLPHLWLGAQSILTTAALVSKALWNPSAYPNDAERNDIAVKHRKEVRKRLGIRGKRWQILERRSVRNMLEHFDSEWERLLLDNPASPEEMEAQIGQGIELSASDAPSDKKGHTFSTLGVSVSLTELADLAVDAGQRARTYLEARDLIF